MAIPTSTVGGEAPASITISANTTLIVPGVHSATITVESLDAPNSPLEVPVTLFYGTFVDTDIDGVSDAYDNCRESPNAEQSDVDEDRIGSDKTRLKAAVCVRVIMMILFSEL